jgi:sensor histidine kinase YesM
MKKNIFSEFDMINREFYDMMNRVLELKINVYEKELEKQKIRMQYLSQQIQLILY